MPPLFNLFIRIVLVIAICSYYLKYRNNQCIINQNCKPYFISHILTPKTKFRKKYFVLYKIENNTSNIELSMMKTPINQQLEEDNLFNKSENNLIRNIIEDFNNNYNYSDLDIVKNNNIIVKKISLKNNSNITVKITPKMIYNNKFFKIYNCFCDSKITMEPMTYRDIFIYFQFIEPDLKELLKKGIKSKDINSAQDLINDDHTIKITL
jgi:hypothetical protein